MYYLFGEAPPPVGRHAVGNPGGDLLAPDGDAHLDRVTHQGLAGAAAAGKHDLENRKETE